MIEMLGDGQQFVAFGRHPEGELYKWGGGKSRRNKPHEIPEITAEQFEAICAKLEQLFGVAWPPNKRGEVEYGWKIARQKRAGEHQDLVVHDPVADWLNDNWETYGVGENGELWIACPFASEHTTDSGPSSTAYFAAGTGGYAQGHFVCLHAHCLGRDDHDFKEATGFNLAQFDDLGVRPGTETKSLRTSEQGDFNQPDSSDPAGQGAERSSDRRDRSVATGTSSVAHAAEAEPPWPSLARDTKGKIEVSARNLVVSIAHPGMVKCQLAYDTFTDALMTRGQHGGNWRRFTDSDTIAIRIELEHRGFGMMGKELLRDCIASVASTNRMDSAQTWLEGLRWDGTERVNKFAHEVWGWADSPYAAAVSQYVWSALAGRVIQPGVRADMAPILVGLQGTRKTTLIQMMAPDEEMYTEVKLDEKDDNMSRKLRGKLVGELEELRGLHSREIEVIKAFITRRKEAWVPKFKEFENFFWRRNLFFGTTNQPEFLADPTGERRWLPGECGYIDVERLVRDRDQYWAEGAFLFAMEGVIWEDAERLAKAEHQRFKVSDTWERRIEAWLGETDIQERLPLDKGFVTIDEVLGEALNIMPAHQNKGHEHRVDRCLIGLGLKRVSESGRAIYRKAS
jgi:predicted P-loop ATPase